MERWFPSADGESDGSLTALRDDCHGNLSRNPEDLLPAPAALGTWGQDDVSTRDHPANAEADAESHDSRRTGKNCLAILPYGKVQPVNSRGEFESVSLRQCNPMGLVLEPIAVTFTRFAGIVHLGTSFAGNPTRRQPGSTHRETKHAVY